jgi:hypothetical protein
MFWIVLWVFLNVLVVSVVSFSMSVSTGAVMVDTVFVGTTAAMLRDIIKADNL